MSSNENATEQIRGLGEKLIEGDPADKALIAECGRALEQFAGSLSGESATVEVVKKTLSALQKLYLEQTPEPALAMKAAGKAVAAVEAAMEAGLTYTVEVAAAAEDLTAALAGESVRCEPGSEETAFRHADARRDIGDADGDKPRGRRRGQGARPQDRAHCA